MENSRYDKLVMILDRNTNWIENCDTKASIILGSVGTFAGICLATDYVKKIITIWQYIFNHVNIWTIGYICLDLLSICTIISGCVHLVGVLMARVDAHEYSIKGIKEDSIIFFNSIAKNQSLEKYSDKVKKCTSKQLEDDIIFQIYVCSLICEKKFSLYKKGLNITLVGFAGFIIITVIGVAIF